MASRRIDFGEAALVVDEGAEQDDAAACRRRVDRQGGGGSGRALRHRQEVGGARLLADADRVIAVMVRSMINRGRASRLATWTTAATRTVPAIHFQFRAIIRNLPS